MTEDELLQHVINKIESLNITVKASDEIGVSAFISPVQYWCVYNPKLISVYDMAHEYMHAYYKDDRRLSECDTLSPAEKRANKEAILMLWDWFVQNGGSSDDIIQFCEITGCQYEATQRLITSMCCDMSNKSFRECAIDYISRFDIITRDTLNIYNFLDFYGYHHNAYDEARALLYELCWFELVY
ncbi:hypothetical protein [Lactococcus lactis]|uniref:hypothetical protein n=1 Tax=Lactococcus lactis TaxID=1358 RepID=UPI0024A8A93B|nr:hypothetical protein [Lactococcus lactis]